MAAIPKKEGRNPNLDPRLFLGNALSGARDVVSGITENPFIAGIGENAGAILGPPARFLGDVLSADMGQTIEMTNPFTRGGAVAQAVRGRLTELAANDPDFRAELLSNPTLGVSLGIAGIPEDDVLGIVRRGRNVLSPEAQERSLSAGSRFPVQGQGPLQAPGGASGANLPPLLSAGPGREFDFTTPEEVAEILAQFDKSAPNAPEASSNADLLQTALAAAATAGANNATFGRGTLGTVIGAAGGAGLNAKLQLQRADREEQKEFEKTRQAFEQQRAKVQLDLKRLQQSENNLAAQLEQDQLRNRIAIDAENYRRRQITIQPSGTPGVGLMSVGGSFVKPVVFDEQARMLGQLQSQAKLRDTLFGDKPLTIQRMVDGEVVKETFGPELAGVAGAVDYLWNTDPTAVDWAREQGRERYLQEQMQVRGLSRKEAQTELEFALAKPGSDGTNAINSKIDSFARSAMFQKTSELMEIPGAIESLVPGARNPNDPLGQRAGAVGPVSAPSVSTGSSSPAVDDQEETEGLSGVERALRSLPGNPFFLTDALR